MSFNSVVCQVPQWQSLFMGTANSQPVHQHLLREFYRAVVTALNPDRPGRNEPRTQKRRPGKYR